MAEQRIPDEDVQSIIEAWKPYDLQHQLAADLRAAREENQRLRQRIEAAEAVIGAACEAADGGEPVDRMVRLMMSRIQNALGGGSGD